jgi:DNA-binding response OmpR family regulator
MTLTSDKEWLDFLTRPSRLLLIEDEEPIRLVFKAYSRLFNYVSDEAADGREGIDRFKQAHGTDNAYNAVLLDLRLPDIYGVDVFKEIKKIDPLMPVVIVSGHITEAAMSEINDIGVASFMRKPFDFRNPSFMAQLFAHLGVRKMESLPPRIFA